MIAVRIGPDWRLVAVAAPSYFAITPTPQHPHELVSHNCIGIRQDRAGGLYAWEFEKGGEELRVRVDGQLTYGTSMAMADAALAGYGIAYVPEDLVRHHVDSGRLVQVLDDWCAPFPGYYVYFPSRRQSLPSFRVIVDALKHGGS
jgi:DNA-binding transcriptional LysR family regulator